MSGQCFLIFFVPRGQDLWHNACSYLPKNWRLKAKAVIFGIEMQFLDVLVLLSRSQSDNLPIASLGELPCVCMRAFQPGLNDNVPPFQYVIIVNITKKKIQFFVCLLTLFKGNAALKGYWLDSRKGHIVSKFEWRTKKEAVCWKCTYWWSKGKRVRRLLSRQNVLYFSCSRLWMEWTESESKKAFVVEEGHCVEFC